MTLVQTLIAKMSAHIRFLSQKVLSQLQLTTTEVIESIESLIQGHSRAQVWNAPKAVITPPDGRYMMATLAAADDPQILAVKTLLLNPKNSHRGLKSIYALVTLLDSDSGLPLAILDGGWVTAVRTAGLSAVAAKRLAKINSSVAAFIGCGVQAHSHLKVFADLFPLKEIRAYGRGVKNRDILCQSADSMGLNAIPSKTAQEAVCDADLIVTSVTISPELEPFLDVRWLKHGAFVTMTDLAAPWYAEGMTAFDRIIIDDIEQEAEMSKPLVQPSLISGDLTGLVTGKVVGRKRASERTAFVFRGLALGDLAVSALAFRRACDTSQGVLVGI
ncbi:ornithine cyclodeaminase family protein [Nitrosomonas sp.]|uniref:ornithine cyclodeaminase family protein n=1 Tax=Nitrosomonas sp. TaxID=42353 RepID=UPI00208CED08|nr:ornithine cyclodeaminase family protein [Nitrosomonas sp.]GJL75711.1 MAG: alanine dehydrogenase [Nitrosomonas sp.]